MSLTKQAKTFELDGVTYTVAPFPTTHGMKLFTEVVMKLGEPLLQLAGVFMKDKDKPMSQMEISPEAIAAIFQGLYMRVNADVLDDLFKRILEGTTSSKTGGQNMRQIYDTYFVDDYGLLFKVVFHSFKGQYGSFLSGVGGLEKLVAMAKNLQK